MRLAIKIWMAAVIVPAVGLMVGAGAASAATAGLRPSSVAQVPSAGIFQQVPSAGIFQQVPSAGIFQQVPSA
jgi:hypothetical protein